MFTTFSENRRLWALRSNEGTARLDRYLANLPSLPSAPPSISIEQERFESSEILSKINLNDIDVLYIFGVGTAACYDTLLPWLAMDEKRAVVFFENDVAVIHSLLFLPRTCRLLKDPQVWLYLFEEREEIVAISRTIAALFPLQRYALSALPSYRIKQAALLSELSRQLSFAQFSSEHAFREYEQLSAGFFSNLYLNTCTIPAAFLGHKLFGLFSQVPAIICGAGPSLEKNGRQLAALQQRALLFAGGSSLNALDTFNILPHIAVGIDPNKAQLSRLYTSRSWMVPYFFRPRLYHEALLAMQGDWVYLAGSGGHAMPTWIEEQLGMEKAATLCEGFNIVNLSISLATALGCNPLILVGVDMAYSGDQSYAKGVTAHPFFPDNNLYRTKQSQEELLLQDDIYGNPVHTVSKWVGESLWLTNFAKTHPNIIMINATEGGIGANEIRNLSLQQASSQFLTNQYDLDGRLHAALQLASHTESLSHDAIIALLERISIMAHKCADICEQLTSGCLKAIERLACLDESKTISQIFEGFPMAELEHSLAEEELFSAILRESDDAFLKTHRLELSRLGNNAFQLPQHSLAYRRLLLQSKRYAFLLQVIRVNIEAVQAALTRYKDKPLRNTLALEGAKDNVSKISADLSWQCSYENGMLHGAATVSDSRGRILSHGQFVAGKKEGNFHKYYKSGAIYSIQHFIADVPNGVHKYFYSNGLHRALIPFVNGLIHGEVDLFFPDGILYRKISFSEGRQDGPERRWNNQGVLVAEATFLTGLPSGSAKLWSDDGIPIEQTSLPYSGVPEGDKNDFFSQLARKSLLFGVGLEKIAKELAHCAELQPRDSALSQKIHGLLNEVDKLKNLGNQLGEAVNLFNTNSTEQIWKTPAVRRQIEEKLSTLYLQISSQFQALENATAALQRTKAMEHDPKKEGK